jgi:hypothetical protein
LRLASVVCRVAQLLSSSAVGSMPLLRGRISATFTELRVASGVLTAP